MATRNPQRARLSKLRKDALIREAMDRGIHAAHDMAKIDIINMLLDRFTVLEGPVPVKVTVFWGRRWNGSWYETTQGEGAHYEVLEYSSPIYARHVGSLFAGCPLGTGPTEEAALQDFVNRAAYEFRGEGQLTVTRLNIVDRRDHRN